MAVYIERTTMPNILKFINDELITKDSFEYSSQEEASNSPLATVLLQFPFIKKVYITANFVAIEKTETINWEDVIEELKTLINEAIVGGEVFSETKEQIPVSIYVEMTPNPEVMKFVANIMLLEGTIEFKSKEETTVSPLASQLFIFPFVKELFITENYIAITKHSGINWDEITSELRNEISKLLKDGIKILRDDAVLKKEEEENSNSNNKKYSSDEQSIKALLDEYVKPAVASDGGNIELIEYVSSTKTVHVLLQGACSGCPSSTMTLKNGIETMLKQFLPEKVEYVEAVNG